MKSKSPQNGAVSSGGEEAENIDSLRFNIPNYFKRQKRAVTKDDYRSLIMGEFRNVESINIWGGEENYHKDYGKVYICVKPKFADKLTATSKKMIEQYLLEHSAVVGMQPIFVDPEFTDVDLTLYAKIMKTLTTRSTGEIERDIIQIITDYNTEILNVFDNSLSDVSLLEKVKSSIPAIKSCYTKKILKKDFSFLYDSDIENVILVGNPIQTGISSTTFTYRILHLFFQR